MQPLLDLFDPFALALVWLGSFAVVSLQEGRHGLLRSFLAWKTILYVNPGRDAQLARQALRRVEGVINVKGLQCIDRITTDSSFVAHAAARLASDQDAGRFSDWAQVNLEDRELRHHGVIRFWMAVADVAPAIGMVGTIIGLVRLFSDLDNSTNLGSAMALALLTTLYGLLLSNVVAAPISHRFQRLSLEELKWQRALIDKLVAMAQNSEKRSCP
ncbi:MotA/TolQ/ExbB proton channel family protein [Parasphingorhabdus cellanae]|uniref:MotA/TolQ/ExbB proton channel family protein n=1 Tax=Parasphingorhabdus cellanae TaxID=2806553 RepID=A0ABX7T4N6_9SPHN|nr:MotA/TolQ/ExbB proton channel family protein [Parasphingorhabdus cellanae]QTD56491.1 MotA/TolQ/ExbB proton channel family protein [Parasphingorhabdus cellanae]